MRLHLLLLVAACAGRAPTPVKGSPVETDEGAGEGEGDGADLDGDGFTAPEDGGADCDDQDADVNPGASELCADGLDNDCDGLAETCGLEVARARIDGASAGDDLGFSVAQVGDVNGDGASDLIMGGVTADLYAEDAGAAWLMAGPFEGALPVSAAVAVLGGAEEDDALGYAVAGPGDVDGDGYADPAVGAPYAEGGAGALYVLAGPAAGERRADALEGAWSGVAAGDRAGIALAALGDSDGDRLPDLAVGANTSDSGGDGAGEVFVLSGTDALGGGALAEGAARIWGEEPGDRAGRVSGAGDVDGDGLADLLVGAPESDAALTDAGLAAVLLAPFPSELTLAEADLRLLGELAGERAGVGLAGLGDADGDGRSDIAVGANSADGEGTDAGEIWLLVALASGTRSLSEADLVLQGESAADMAGWPLSAPGDLDQDGLADLLVGAFGSDRAAPGAGAIYAVSGLQRGSGSLGETMGRWLGEAEGDAAGFSLSGSGPEAGDAEAALLIGAYGRDEGAGAVYVLDGLF